MFVAYSAAFLADLSSTVHHHVIVLRLVTIHVNPSVEAAGFRMRTGGKLDASYRICGDLCQGCDFAVHVRNKYIERGVTVKVNCFGDTEIASPTRQEDDSKMFVTKF